MGARIRFSPLLVLAFAGACRSEPPPVLFVPPPPAPAPPGSTPFVQPAEPEPALAAAKPVDDSPLDLATAPRVALKASPAKAGAPRPIGTRPAKTRLLKETAKVADASALERAEAPTKYDPKLPFEFRAASKELPPGARRDIPLSHDGVPLKIISESGGKLLLNYGGRHVAVVDGKKVEQVLDLDPPELPLTKDDRLFSDVDQAIFREGVLYVCRGYNGWLPGRKGYVTAIDTATGDLRWRSEPKTCGGVLALIDDYVITGYGAHDTPYALKLLRRSDGSLAQSVPLFGAALELTVNSDVLVASTYKHRVTYLLQP